TVLALQSHQRPKYHKTSCWATFHGFCVILGHTGPKFRVSLYLLPLRRYSYIEEPNIIKQHVSFHGFCVILRSRRPNFRPFRYISYRFGATATSKTQVSEIVMLGILSFF
ncbi:Phenylalanine-4-hydroxylase, partial [Frankliniella fusca]